MENDEEPVRELIDQITGDDLVGAEGSFKDILADKVASALDNKKVELANSVYNGIDANDIEIDAETEMRTLKTRFQTKRLIVSKKTSIKISFCINNSYIKGL